MNERERLANIIIQTPCVAVSSKTAAYHIADHLLANGVTVQRWIPVTERLPEEAGDYNVMLEGFRKATSLFYLVVNQKWVDDFGVLYPVTHWMPIPEPPKEEE